ncbi:flagellar protein FlbB [Spirochaetia bacterium]|nr:flagellar protein FlbB [Spirochaetia bacterium]
MVGRIVVLLLLIAVLLGGGLVWFDYLNVIDAKQILAPAYQLVGLQPRTQKNIGDDEFLNLDAERLAIRLEALDLRDREMDRQQTEIQSRQGEIEQMAQELEERQKSLDERENSFNAMLEETENKSRNIEQVARYWNGMPPEDVVAIIAETKDDQFVIDVLRKTDELAEQEGSSSVVSYWLSLLRPRDRAAELQQKMASRPAALY